MSPRTPPPPHPAEYSTEVLQEIGPRLMRLAPERVHDPFAGRGRRLGHLCDLLEITFTGTDREQYPDADRRVQERNANDPAGYPPAPFVVVTSPVYFDNRTSSDYVNGPTPTTNMKGRRSYGISLGRALHPDNLARVCRPGQEAAYYGGHGEAVKHWGERAIVNVDSPLADDWCTLLVAHGYRIDETIPVHTSRYRGLAGSDKRADHEIVIVATRPTDQGRMNIMTTIDRERQRRIFALLDRKPAMTEDQAAAEIDAELEIENAQAAERQARADEMVASMDSLAFRCAVCGGTRSPQAADALCNPCRRVVAQVRAERAAAETVGESTRLALAIAYVDQRG
jgi:hypothetical protein